jgi:hypothetical protein
MAQIPNKMRFLGVDSSLIDLVEKKDYINNEKTEYYSLDDIRGYKVYTALLSQSGTDAPTAVVLENTIGNIWFTYSEQGFYKIKNDSNLFITGKTFFYIAQFSPDSSSSFALFIGDENTMNIEALNGFDDSLLNTSIEIRVYN